MGDCLIFPSEKVKDLGVILDERLCMKQQVSSLVSQCHNQLRKIGRVRRNLTTAACHSAMRNTILTRLDYCNSLLGNVGAVQVGRLQRVQNSAARIISLKRKDESISPTIMSLHWLKVRERITFKILTITFKCLQSTAPEYLDELVPVYKPVRSLRSSIANNIDAPKLMKKVGEGAFSAAAPKLWNGLPPQLKSCGSLSQFKKLLKTYLFTQW